MAKTTEQLEHALANTQATGVELRAVEVVGEGSAGSAASQREVERVRSEVSTRRGKREGEFGNTVFSWYFGILFPHGHDEVNGCPTHEPQVHELMYANSRFRVF